ncbi:hypothetical protein O3P69_020711 [Scylla paramamosain]|uniref:Uncharacterized protein n=1 Tax=Scylla paramamosain TaxID=85552 RepID=A0AAW0TMF0_SCYPA
MSLETLQQEGKGFSSCCTVILITQRHAVQDYVPGKTTTSSPQRPHKYRLLLRLQHLLCLPPSPNLPAISSHFTYHQLLLCLPPALDVPATNSCCACHHFSLCLPPVPIVPSLVYAGSLPSPSDSL